MNVNDWIMITDNRYINLTNIVSVNVVGTSIFYGDVGGRSMSIDGLDVEKVENMREIMKQRLRGKE